MQPEAHDSKWRLHGLYYLIQFSGLAVLLFFGALIYRYPEYFAFLKDTSAIVALVAVIFAAHLILFILRELFQSKAFFVISRYLWVFFFLAVAEITGGVDSPFLFLLVFPLLVSVTDLDERATRLVGILLTVLFGTLILLDPSALAEPATLVKHGMRTILFGVISYYLYSIVKETLRQKYEKEETKRKFAELLELDKVKTDFLTVAQHQLRTPLSGLRWGFENLKADATLSNKTRALVTESAKKAEDAIAIVNEMLRTAEMKTASFTLAKSSVKLASLVAAALEELQFLTARKRVTVSLARTAEVELSADPKLLGAALLNILDNAVRYSPGGKVEVTVREEDGRAEVAVRDTGIGIEPDDLPYLFDRFYRGKNALSLEPNESGVGLYIAKQLIEKHGGTIAVDSTLGKGTTVIVSLPSER